MDKETLSLHKGGTVFAQIYIFHIARAAVWPNGSRTRFWIPTQPVDRFNTRAEQEAVWVRVARETFVLVQSSCDEINISSFDRQRLVRASSNLERYRTGHPPRDHLTLAAIIFHAGAIAIMKLCPRITRPRELVNVNKFFNCHGTRRSRRFVSVNENSTNLLPLLMAFSFNSSFEMIIFGTWLKICFCLR